MLRVLIHSVLFLGYVAARKKHIFAPQIKERRISGRCPEPRRLLKKADENFHPVGVDHWGDGDPNFILWEGTVGVTVARTLSYVRHKARAYARAFSLFRYTYKLSVISSGVFFVSLYAGCRGKKLAISMVSGCTLNTIVATNTTILTVGG